MTGRKLLALLVIGLFFYVASPLVLPVVMGGVLAVLFFPWLGWLEKRKLPTWGASMLLTIGVTLVFLLPTAILVFLGAKTGLQQLHSWKDAPRGAGTSVFEKMINTPGVHRVIEQISAWFPVTLDELLTSLEDIARTVGLKVADLLGSAASQLPGMAMAFVIMVLSIYFFLADGRKIITYLRKYSLFDREHTEQLIGAFSGMCRSVILASLVSGLVQALMFSITCIAMGVPSVSLIAFSVFLCSFIPLVGSLPLTLGVALQQLLVGQKLAGIVLLIMGIIVALIDNLIRPLVLKGGAKLHPLLAFIAAFGGLQILGVSGIFVGPIIAGIFVVMVRILLESESNSLSS